VLCLRIGCIVRCCCACEKGDSCSCSELPHVPRMPCLPVLPVFLTFFTCR
jgi:hypothetical protein